MYPIFVIKVFKLPATLIMNGRLSLKHLTNSILNYIKHLKLLDRTQFWDTPNNSNFLNIKPSKMSNTIKKSVHLTGHVGKDVILSQCHNGNKKATLILATNIYQTDANNIKTQKTVWHKIIAWGRLAEDIAVVAKKGSKLNVTGFTQSRTFKDPAGNIRKTYEVILIDFIQWPKVTEVKQEAYPF
jgi:single-strand DNA-binding protein